MTEVEQVWAKRLAELAGLPQERLQVTIMYGVMPGKTGVRVEGVPPLTAQEDERLMAAMVRINQILGGRPIIKSGSA
jgi:hypothetical protein